MKRKGILLFEVLISIAVISTVLLFIMRAYSVSKKSLQRATAAIRLALLLEDKMWELEEKEAVREGFERGYFKDEGYAWKIEAQSQKDSGLNLVTLEVFAEERPETERYSLSTYFKNRQW